MPQYKVILKGGFEMRVDANNYQDLYNRLEQAGVQEKVDELWAKMTVRVIDNGGE